MGTTVKCAACLLFLSLVVTTSTAVPGLPPESHASGAASQNLPAEARVLPAEIPKSWLRRRQSSTQQLRSRPGGHIAMPKVSHEPENRGDLGSTATKVNPDQNYPKQDTKGKQSGAGILVEEEANSSSEGLQGIDDTSTNALLVNHNELSQKYGNLSSQINGSFVREAEMTIYEQENKIRHSPDQPATKLHTAGIQVKNYADGETEDSKGHDVSADAANKESSINLSKISIEENDLNSDGASEEVSKASSEKSTEGNDEVNDGVRSNESLDEGGRENFEEESDQKVSPHKEAEETLVKYTGKVTQLKPHDEQPAVKAVGESALTGRRQDETSAPRDVHVAQGKGNKQESTKGKGGSIQINSDENSLEESADSGQDSENHESQGAATERDSISEESIEQHVLSTKYHDNMEKNRSAQTSLENVRDASTSDETLTRAEIVPVRQNSNEGQIPSVGTGRTTSEVNSKRTLIATPGRTGEDVVEVKQSSNAKPVVHQLDNQVTVDTKGQRSRSSAHPESVKQDVADKGRPRSPLSLFPELPPDAKSAHTGKSENPKENTAHIAENDSLSSVGNPDNISMNSIPPNPPTHPKLVAKHDGNSNKPNEGEQTPKSSIVPIVSEPNKMEDQRAQSRGVHPKLQGKSDGIATVAGRIRGKSTHPKQKSKPAGSGTGKGRGSESSLKDRSTGNNIAVHPKNNVPSGNTERLVLRVNPKTASLTLDDNHRGESGMSKNTVEQIIHDTSKKTENSLEKLPVGTSDARESRTKESPTKHNENGAPKNAKDSHKAGASQANKSNNEQVSNMVASISIAIMALVSIATIIGAIYKKISFSRQRYGEHMPLSTEEDDELPLYSRYESPYESWKAVS